MPLKGSNIIAFKTPPAASASQPAPRPREALRVLIIDDTPEDRMVVRMALETQGFMLNEAQDGASGIAAARALAPDCIVLDYRLPDFDGLEVLDALRGPDGDIPYAVVMLTGTKNGPTAARLLLAGALDYLSKDYIGEDSLRRAVVGAVERFRGMEERRRLQERNARLAAVVNASDDAIISISLDLTVLTWNPGAESLFGYSEPEAVGANIDELIVDESWRHRESYHYDDIVSRRQAVIVEAVRRHKDGSPIDVEINAAPIVTEDGSVIGISVILRDIRERKKASKLIDHVMRSAPVSIYLFNPETGANEIASDSAGELLGYDPERWRRLKGNPMALLHPEDAPAMADHLDRLQHEPDGVPLSFEYRMRHADGGWRWFLSRDLVFQRRPDGKPARVLGTALDITERRQTEAALQEVTDRLSLALQAGAAGIWSWDIVTGEIYWSAENYQLYDIDPDGGPPRYQDWEARLHPNDRAQANRAVEEAIAGQGEEFRTEFRIVTRQGQSRWLQGIGRVDRNADGAALRLSGINLDITARKQADEALLHSEARFRGIFEHATTGIVIGGVDLSVVRVNPALCALLGYSERELLEGDLSLLIHPDDREDNLAQALRLATGDLASYEIENRYIHKHGHPIWVRKFVFALPDEQGRPQQLVALVTDMTGHRKREDHVKLLMREVNHRAKNMLGVVDAIARLTAIASPKDFTQRFSERIHALAAGLDLLVDEDWKGVPLEALIAGQLAHLRDAIGTRITIGGPPLRVSEAAARTMGMALHELATNAAKYGALSNRDGRVEIAWRLEPAEAGEQLMLSWEERDGPPVAQPARKGFGTTVIVAMVESNLAAGVQLDYAESGLTWRLACPAAQVLEADEGELSAGMERGHL